MGRVPPTTTFDSLEIEYDDRVLSPRPWTALQAHWAAELLGEAPAGAVLELCAGAGQIGLLAISRQPRHLVCVDSSPVACDFARGNAVAAGLGELVDIRERPLEDAVAPDERFALVIADPPWVPRDETDRFPEDPLTAIDGGPDGLDVARSCVRVAAAHLLPGASILLQLGTREQASTLAGECPDLELLGLRDADGGVVVLLRPR
ncbi:Conserved hypothetical protein 95 [Nocardioides terrae]|uniref:Methyltransferase n=1 Tax=Nocardioides terrae TaxID=574651 RepID=A0A1I1DYN1_9ACTN|nr:RsmD family RNA methyltransferase [Nocardioides terrae]SFB79934.1 Conserved hypothetical protein 95 [Nocardioides terrae]